MITILHTNGEIEQRDDDDVSLPLLQKWVGGWIECVPHFTKYNGDECVAVCDEEGKLKHYPVNQLASQEWYKQIGVSGGDFLVGPIVVLTGKHLEEWRR